MKHILTLIVILIIALLFGVLFFGDKPSKAMERLQIGSSYSELLTMAGKPSYETDGTLWVETDFLKEENQIVPGCVKEVWYESFLKILPSKYSFCFDSEDRLIHKYHWQSW